MPSMALKVPSAHRSSRKRCAARQGPIVCELDGPTPIFIMSKTLKYCICFAITLKKGQRAFRKNEPSSGRGGNHDKLAPSLTQCPGMILQQFDR
jgi:hypothetical protein